MALSKTRDRERNDTGLSSVFLIKIELDVLRSSALQIRTMLNQESSCQQMIRFGIGLCEDRVDLCLSELTGSVVIRG